MDELPPDARRLLEAARHAADPLPAERARADAAARTALAAQGFTDLPALDPTQVAHTATGGSAAPPGAGGGLGLKLGLAAVAVATLTLFATQQLPPMAAPRPPATATTPPPQPPATTPSVQTEVVPAQPVRPAEPSGHDQPDRARAPRPPKRVYAMAQHASDADLQAEVQLIAEANALLQADRFEQALQVLDQHAQRFPGGALRAERAGLRVLSLCGQGSTAQGTRERERFLRAAPDSLLTARVRAACAAEPAETP